MNRKWLRLLSAWMCLVLILGQVPAIADDPAVDFSENVEVTSEVEVPEEPSGGAPEEPPVSPTETEVPPPVEEHTEAPVEPTEEPAEGPTEEPVEDIPQQPAQPETQPGMDGPEIFDESYATPEPEIPSEPEAPAPTLDEIVSEWMSAMSAQGLSDDYHRALWLYDRLIANLAPGGAQDALSALTTLEASPAGYALAYAALLQAANIECMTLTDGASTWTLAKLDGAWTNIDVSADDSDGHYGTHFGLTDAALGRTPVWVGVLPSASDASLNYAVREQGYAAFANPEELRALLAAAAENRAEELHLYNAGAAVELPTLVAELLAEIAPYAESAVARRDCYATVALRYSEEPEAGTASIDAFAPIDGLSLEAPALEAIVPTASALTLGVGETASVGSYTLVPAEAVDEISFSSKKAAIASVDAEGNITAKKPGSTEIVLSSASGVSATVKVTVANAPKSVAVTAERTELGVSETMKLGYKLNSGATGKVDFSVPDDGIATVTDDGLFTACQPGSVTVTATAYNGAHGELTITVKNKPTYAKLSVEILKLGQGDSFTVGCEIDEGAAGKAAFSSTNVEIASVDPHTGKITASETATGSADITATVCGIVSAPLHVEVVPAPKSVQFVEPRTVIGVKESVKLNVAVSGPDGAPFQGTNCPLSFKSSKTSVATVSADGTVYGKKAGSATITVTTYGGKAAASVKVTVKKAPKKVSISASRTTLGVGEALQLGYSLTSGSAGGVTFSIPPEQQGIATVTEGGLVKALSPGVATVTAQAFNGKGASVNITVKRNPDSVQFDLESIRLGAGETYQPAWHLNPQNDSASKVQFETSDESIAKVDPNTGKITVAKDLTSGSATITVRTHSSEDPFVAECSDALHVEVVPAPASVQFVSPRTVIGVKESVKFETLVLDASGATYAGDNLGLSFKTSKKSVATVSADGTVYGKKAGSAKITATTYNGKSYTVKVTVKKAPKSVNITSVRSPLGVKETLQLGYTLSGGSAGGATFSVTEGEAFGEVTPSGLVTAKAPGKFTVTAETFNHKTKSVVIEVKDAPTGVALSRTEPIRLGLGDAWTLAAKPNDGAAGKITFSSDNEGVAVVDVNSGRIVAKGLGTANITATAYNEVAATLRVTVIDAPASVKLNAPRTTIGVKEYLKLETLVLDANGAPFTGDSCTLSYKTSKKSVATVSADGTVYGKKAGSAKITVTTYNKKSYTVKVTVKKAPKSVNITSVRSPLGVKETLQLGYTLSGGSAGGATFSVTDGEAFGEVTPSGLVTAKAPGKFTVTAETFNHKTKSVVIEVKDAPTGIALSRTEPIKLGLGDAWTLAAKPNDGAAGKITFSSDNEGVAAVDANSGRIVAKGLGTANITATAYNEVAATLRVTVIDAPASVQFVNPRTVVGVKEYVKLSTLVLGANSETFTGDVCTLSYKTSKKSVATVSADGTVYGKKAGSAKITVSTYNGKSYTVKVTVKKAPKKVYISADRRVLGVDEEMKLGYYFNSGAAGGATFSIPPEQQQFATVTEDGLVTAHKAGGAVTVTARAFNGKYSTIGISTLERPTRIDILSAPAVLGEGATAMLNAAVNEGSAGKLYYKLADPASAVATIDANGKITAKSAGTVELVVYTYAEGVEARTALEVKPAPQSVALPVYSINLGVGDTYQIEPIIAEGTAANFSYSSSKTKYATVSGTGAVYGKKAGKSVITVKTHNGKTAKLTVNVKKAPSSVSVSPTALTLGIGETGKLSVSITKNTATTLRYESSDSKVASLAADGTITGLTEGTTTIKVTTHNNKSASCTVTVVPAPTAIQLTVPTVVGVGQIVVPSYALTPGNAHTTPTYSIASGAEFAHLDAKNQLIADKKGTVKLRVSTHVEGVSAEIEITVKYVPKKISFDQANYWVDLKGEYGPLQLLPTLDPADAATSLTYTIAKQGYFTIDKDGWVTPVKAGHCDVKVTTHNKLSASATVWIVEDPKVPQILTLVNTPPAYLEKGDTFRPVVSVFPETADAQLVWSSANPASAPVDPETGEVTAVGSGRVTITGQSQSNPNLKVTYQAVVLGGERCLVMPDHRIENYTSSQASTIENTLMLIDRVKDSAYAELNDLVASGQISSSERNTRQGYVDRAFKMYRFAWRPTSVAPYWKAANDEGGGKNFYKQNVYFGMPYTQTNRTHSSLSGSKASDGNYINVSLPKNRKYPGSDCSSFVSMAVWGTGSGRRSDNTTKIASASYYKTISGWGNLRTGDLICKGGSHVVMFLYYTNAAHTQFVVIEQGGGGNDRYSNCVSTSIRDASYYSGKKYKIRRVKSLA